MTSHMRKYTKVHFLLTTSTIALFDTDFSMKVFAQQMHLNCGRDMSWAERLLINRSASLYPEGGNFIAATA
jgi:hypothetical protein